MNKAFPHNLQPDSTESFLINNISVDINVTHKLFKPWQGEPIANTFGGKPLVDYEDEAIFAELAIQRLALKSGWQARWVETYSMKTGLPYYFSGWSDAKLPEQIVDPMVDETQLKLINDVASFNHGSFYGCWDVIAWNDKRTLFLEAKRSKKDKIRNTQLAWIEAGLAAGLNLDNYLIVQWGFSLAELNG